MASSIIVPTKTALITLLAARAGLSGVQVTFGWPGDDRAKKERIFTGRSYADQEQASLRAGRRFRDETGNFDLVIQVESVGGSISDAETRILAIGQEVEECVADNKTLGGVSGLNWAVITGWTLDDMYNDQGSLAELTYTITYNARLT